MPITAFLRYRSGMENIDLGGLDAKLEGERQRLLATLRRIADRLEALALADVSEPLTLLSESVEALIRRAEGVLRVPLGSQPLRGGRES